MSSYTKKIRVFTAVEMCCEKTEDTLGQCKLAFCLVYQQEFLKNPNDIYEVTISLYFNMSVLCTFRCKKLILLSSRYTQNAMTYLLLMERR
jgi:hypothetical protein